MRKELVEILSMVPLTDTGIDFTEPPKIGSKEFYTFEYRDPGGELRTLDILGGSSVIFPGSLRLFEINDDWRPEKLNEFLLTKFSSQKR